MPEHRSKPDPSSVFSAEPPARPTSLVASLTTLLASLTICGACLLKLPPCLPEGGSITWIEALFTAASAATLTGLAAIDPATRLSPIGQGVLLLIVQLAGVAMLTLGAVLASRLSSSRAKIEPGKTLARVAVTALTIEACAALALAALWPGELGVTQRLSLGCFHAVTAFCNAGFTLQSDGLVDLRHTMAAHAVLAPLIVIGSLGWPALRDLADAARTRSAQAISTHTRLALGVTATAYLTGVLLIATAQLAPRTYDFFKLGNEPNKPTYASTGLRQVGAAVADASFLAIAARSGGMSTAPASELTPATNVTLMALMAVGGSPGSTAGGLKTVVVALLFLNLWSVLRLRPGVTAFGAAVPDASLRRASAAGLALAVLVIGAVVLLSISEPAPFIKIAFEAVSASTNAGLSLGITGSLTGFGKLILVGCMFIGRLGPLAVAALLLTEEEPRGEDVPMLEP